ncbi:MAG TPA: acyl-CoA carboxylase subunit epsilon [Sporichthyaceae bacterium]|jgi:hypothetical protein|nr:acyl-CoA carboxylase subunit epsilon [Sporichthyaceae bacterium]
MYTAESEPSCPVLRIVRGEPSDEELAALVAVLSTRAGATAPAITEAPSVWRDRAALLRKSVHPGPGAWRAATWRL